jgi:hypothetical protein
MCWPTLAPGLGWAESYQRKPPPSSRGRGSRTFDQIARLWRRLDAPGPVTNDRRCGEGLPPGACRNGRRHGLDNPHALGAAVLGIRSRFFVLAESLGEGQPVALRRRLKGDRLGRLHPTRPKPQCGHAFEFTRLPVSRSLATAPLPLSGEHHGVRHALAAVRCRHLGRRGPVTAIAPTSGG